MRIIRNYWFLVLVLFLAIFLRLYKINSVPSSLNWDEAALGYNAYSILHTGKDEYGQFLPLVFKSFGDYKPGLYVYLAVPFVAIFGLSELAVRLPSVIFGSLTVVIFYFVVLELFNRKRLAQIAALFLAISPWHLLISRPAFEANVALFFNLLGIYFFLKFTKIKSTLSFLISTFSFLISLYTYHGSKLMVPLLVFGLGLIWFKDIVKLSFKQRITAFIFVLLAIPIYFGAIFGSQGGRFEVFSVFSYPLKASELDKLANEDQSRPSSLTFNLFHSQQYYFARTITTNYLNYFSSRYLFFEGDFQNQRTKIPGNGMMYLFDLIFIVFGIYAFSNSNFDRSKKYFSLFWLFTAPIPGALTRDAVSPLRAANLILPLLIISALGAMFVLEKLQEIPRFLLVLSFLATLLFVVIFFKLFDGYFNHFPKASSKEWLYGQKEVVRFINENYDRFRSIVFTTAYNEPYIFTLFYSQYPPEKYQPQAKLESFRGIKDVGEVRSFDKFIFRHVNYPGDLDLKQTLLIGTPQEIPENELLQDESRGKLVRLKDIKFLNGDTAFRIIATR